MSKVIIRCIKCGREALRKPSEVAKGHNKYCSRACRRVVLDERPCAKCGTPFKPASQAAIARGQGLYCSRACYWAAGREKVPLAERFWSKVNKEGPVPAHLPALGPCWEWTAHRSKAGYGRIGAEGSRDVLYAHHVAWELTYGDRRGLWVLHKCDNPACVRPAHLFLGTHDQNMADAVTKGRMHVGERSAQAKLSSSQVEEIRVRYAAGTPAIPLAQEFGVRKGTVRSIVSGRRWAHLKGAARRAKKMSPERAEYARGELAKGRSQAEVGRELGISAPYMHRIAHSRARST